MNVAAARMAGEYARVICVGHSMGCLLGLNAQLEFSPFAGMALLACPVAIRFTARYVHHNWLSPMLPGSRNPFVRAAVEANSVRAKHPLEYLTTARPYLELLRLIRETNEGLRRLDIPARAVYSELDEIVSPRASELLLGRAGIETVVAPGCGHDFYSPEGRDLIENIVRNMLDRE